MIPGLTLCEQLWENPVEFSSAWNFGPKYESMRTVGEVIDKVSKLWGGSASWEYSNSNLVHESTLLNLGLPHTAAIGALPAGVLSSEWAFLSNLIKINKQEVKTLKKETIDASLADAVFDGVSLARSITSISISCFSLINFAASSDFDTIIE